MPRKKSEKIVEAVKSKKPLDVKDALNEAMAEKVVKRVKKISENVYNPHDENPDHDERVTDDDEDRKPLPVKKFSETDLVSPETQKGKGDTRSNIDKALDELDINLNAMSATLGTVAKKHNVTEPELRAAHKARQPKATRPAVTDEPDEVEVKPSIPAPPVENKPAAPVSPPPPPPPAPPPAPVAAPAADMEPPEKPKWSFLKWLSGKR